MAKGSGIYSAFLRALPMVAERAFSLLSPSRCRLCRTALFDHAQPFLCRDCLAAMHWIGAGACRGCGYPAGPHASHGDHCHRCRKGHLNLTAAAAVARYKGGARNLVRSFKFAGETELARPLAGLLAERLAQADFGKPDLLVPVVLHPNRRRQRGFDQTALLSARLGVLTGLESRPDLVTRTRHTTPQSFLRREARLKNMEGAFVADAAMEGRSVVLIDDVMTTGATMGACARACRLAGARRVYGLVFAR